MPGEFSLIDHYFRNIGNSDHSAVLGVGDDAAVVSVPEGQQLVMSVDTLIAGVHFPTNTSPADIAHKALAVNLSDLAAMAAKPAWFLLSLTLPKPDESWLREFSQSLKNIADQYRIELIGGDTCHGPLSITIQVNGIVEQGCYLSRSGAEPGDLIVVSGELGNAALGLAHLQERVRLSKALSLICIEALNRPVPRLCLADFLHNYASAAIDVSDGLIADLRHILDNSAVGADIRQFDLPVNQWIRDNDAYQYALSGGDDYELCFTLSKQHSNQLSEWNQQNADCPLRVIGGITRSGYYLFTGEETIDLSDAKGYQHFGQ